MNPNSKKPGYLFFTPRTPWGTRAGQHSFRQHQRASEDGRELPEEDKDGRFQGKIESSGETHGKPENSFEFQINSNPRQKAPASQSDPLWDKRREYDPQEAERKKQRAQVNAAQAAKAAQQPKQLSKWKFTAPPASSLRVPGL